MTHQTTPKSPMRRSNGMSERPLDGDLLLHDTDADRVTTLDAEAAAVWRLCDGAHSIEEIAADTGQPVEEVAGRLATLDDAGLLATVGMTRRSLLTRAGVVGLAVPVVSVLNLPAAAAANSVLAQTTTFSCTMGTTASTNNHLIVNTIMTGATPGTNYNVFIYTSAALTPGTLVGSDLLNAPTGGGVVTFATTTNTGQLVRGSTIYLKITKGNGSITTDTVFQVVIPTTASIYCTAP